MNFLAKSFQSYKNKKIVITGGNGYIGSSLSASLSKYTQNICIHSRSKNNNFQEHKNYTYLYGDLCDDEIWKSIINFADIIFHLGENTSIYSVENDVDKSANSSIKVMTAFDNAIKRANKKIRFIYASTASIYGLNKKNTISESETASPITIYDLHKQYVENHLAYLANNQFIEYISLRLSNVYGPGNSILQASDRGILTKIMKMAIGNHDIKLYGDGKYFRDYVYIDDVVKSFLLAGINKYVNNSNFNVCYGEGITVKDAFTEILNSVHDSKSSIILEPWPINSHEIDKRNFVGDNNKFYLAFGWKPEINFQKGIAKLLLHELNNYDE
jgi:UDP-glucose 4-epimerase